MKANNYLNRRDFIKTLGLTSGMVTLPGCFSGNGFFSDDAPGLPRPIPAQLAWQQAELGYVFHYDLHVFDGKKYNQSYNRDHPVKDIDIFNPNQLDTDQWIETVAAAGGRFAILTASHETGFRLWQSDANPYCLKALKWRNGKGDIVRDFVNSCRKYKIKPGIYLGCRWNSHLGVLDFKVQPQAKISQAEYNKLLEQEMVEICTRYGELFEIWFDGGIATPERGGPDVLRIFEKYQPHCLFYHSDQRRDARWGGTENGTVGYPCWSTIDLEKIKTRPWTREYQQILMHGEADGKDWSPAMADAPLRGHNGRHEWFWEPGDEAHIYPLRNLMEMYYKSVGRNSTLILGLTPDPRGLMPEPDVKRLTEFGSEIKRRFQKPIAQAKGTGTTLELELAGPTKINHVIIQEDISRGHRVRKYAVEALRSDKSWKEICSGSAVGHKRIQQFEPVETTKIRFNCTESRARPRIANLAVYNIETYSL